MSAFKRPLRVGLFLGTALQPAWIERLLIEVIGTGRAEFAVVVIEDHSADRPEPARNNRLKVSRRARSLYSNCKAIVFDLFCTLDAWRYQPKENPERSVDLCSHLQGTPVIRVSVQRTEGKISWPEAVLLDILQYDLDVALAFGSTIAEASSSKVAHFGIWSLRRGISSSHAGDSTGFWEVFEKQPTIDAALVRKAAGNDGETILGRCSSRTNPNSPLLTRANCYPDASALVLRELRQLYEEGEGSLANDDKTGTFFRPATAVPSIAQVIRLLVMIVTRLVKGKIDEVFYRRQWFLAYMRRAPGEQRQQNGLTFPLLEGLQECIQPRDRHWADPFPVLSNGTHFIFFEEHLFAAAKAHICVVELSSTGVFGTPRCVLRRNYHLSYPSVFQWENQWYMIPETVEREQVELFKANAFPDDWEYVGPLVPHIRAVDATVAKIEGTWWLFVGVMTPGSDDATALHIFFAETPLGPWTSHLRNPVKVDVQGCRPAGRLFKKDHLWYRPGQQGAPNYGAAIVLHRIEELSPTRFHETVVERLMPTWRSGLFGTHTFNAVDGLAVIDGLQKIRR